MLVARTGRPLGIIALADQTREAGRDTVEMLRRQGMERVVMLTGDNQATADALARELGIDEAHAELLPHDKVAAVHTLRRKYGTVAMVGDGVNDAPALAAADVGIAMGVAGADAALETADIALMADELLKIPFALRLGRATLRNIHMNVTLSLGLEGGVSGPCDRRLGHIVDGGRGRHGSVAAGDRQRHEVVEGGLERGEGAGRGMKGDGRKRGIRPAPSPPPIIRTRDTRARPRLRRAAIPIGLHGVANLRAPAQASEHVAADRRVGFLVDLQAELLVDVGHEREAVDFCRSVG